MKPRHRLLALLALAFPAVAAAPVDYATQWPLQLQRAGAEAYTLQLDESIYRAVQRADVRDLDVLDADGKPVPAMVLPPPAVSRAQTATPPWFVMPPVDAGGSDAWRVVADLDADGRLRGLRTAAATSTATATTLLLDMHGIAGEPVAIAIDWTPGAPFEQAYRVEGSDDFDAWYPLGRDRLVDLRQGAHRLLQARLPLASNGHSPRYLRVVPERDVALPAVTAVTVETRTGGAAAMTWTVLPPASGMTYRLRARLPVRSVDVDVAGNDARVWQLQSRESADAPWRTRIDGWVAYRLGSGRSAPRDLGMAVRDREWRLVANAAGDAPRLRLGYAPEQLVFLGAGRPPYTLVAGSMHAARADAPVAQTLASLRSVHGAGWRPDTAVPGPMQTRAGDVALAPVRDWKAWSLWAVLVVGVLVVGLFAVRVLREAPPEA